MLQHLFRLPASVRTLFAKDAPAMQFTRTTATVMFTDIENSSSLAQELGLFAFAGFLKHHRCLTSEIVREHGGVALQFTGDGILAVWNGAGTTSAHDARQALQAAAKLSRKITAVNAKRRSDGLAVRRVRIGVHSGEVLVEGRDDSNPEFLYGATVHLARRIEQAAKAVDAGACEVTIMASAAALLLAGTELADDGSGPTRRMRDKPFPQRSRVPEMCSEKRIADIGSGHPNSMLNAYPISHRQPSGPWHPMGRPDIAWRNGRHPAFASQRWEYVT